MTIRGNGSSRTARQGYDCIQVDLKLGQDVRMLRINSLPKIHGVLAAPPCTTFAGSGAQYWKKKDTDGRTLEGLSIVDACLRIVIAANPEWWCLENPVGRLRDFIGPYRMTFNPCDFGDPYTKRTCLWGRFNTDLPLNRVKPHTPCKSGSWIMQLGGSSNKTKELRSITPPGFARAFFEANP